MLELNNITFRYGTAEAIRNVTVALETGSAVSIIGANGAGKSTILRAVSGLVPLDGGDVRFLGQRVDGLPINKIVGLGIAHVPEGRKLFPTCR
jgi:branched-chain amino acid transport system ATP-binding protein